MKIDKERIVAALATLPEGYTDSLGHAMLLLAYIVDAGRPVGNKPKRVEAMTASDMLTAKYRVTIEEVR